MYIYIYILLFIFSIDTSPCVYAKFEFYHATWHIIPIIMIISRLQAFGISALVVFCLEGGWELSRLARE